MHCETVLYVEDEENDVIFMRYAWKKLGLNHALQVVTDGSQAIHYLAGESEFADRKKYPMPCLVLLDLKLPRASGLEVLKWIRLQPDLHTLRVIILSSSNQPADVHQAHSLHANAYLVKPSDAEGMAKMVSSLNDFWMSLALIPPDCSQFKR